MENLKLAWRNLWRNKRRTLITVASVFFAVFFALSMRSLQLGSYDVMFKNIIESYTGYVQVQHNDFWDDKTIDNLIKFTPELEAAILEDKNVNETVMKIESFALASSGPQSKGVLVMGIDPLKEKYVSDIESKLIKYILSEEAIKGLKRENIPEELKEQLDIFNNSAYSTTARLQLDLGIDDEDFPELIPLFDKHASFESGYLESGKQQVVVGYKVAQYLHLELGDTLILIGQGYHGVSAAGKFEITGVVKMPSPDIDSRVVYIPVDIAQEFYDCPDMLTSLALQVNDNDDEAIYETVSRLTEKLGDDYAVLGWQKMNELMVQQMEADNQQGYIMIIILYMVIAFGIFGTVLMMTAERRREFGVLVSIGMQKTKLAIIVTYEMMMMGLLGILSGVAAGIPLIWWGLDHPIRFSGEMAKVYEDMGFEPIMAFQPFDTYFYNQAMIVFLIVLVAMSYPVRKISKLDVIEALRA
jgi:putative ABC transport system permease protein